MRRGESEKFFEEGCEFGREVGQGRASERSCLTTIDIQESERFKDELLFFKGARYELE